MKHSPYISFINFARNDDYCPNRAERHNLSLNFLIQQLKDFKIPSEIIIVEWNYPEDKLPLSDTIKITVDTSFTKVKVIRVPSEYHQRYKFWEHKVFHVGAAVNVGARRANGKFMLPIASDIFLKDECLKRISKFNLKGGCVYRVDRYDVDPLVFSHLGNNNRREFLDKCKENIKVHHKYLIQEPTFKIRELHTNGCGDFLLVPLEAFKRIRGDKEGKDVGGLDIDSLVLHSLCGLGLKQIIWKEGAVFKMFHGKSTSRSVTQEWKPWQKTLERYTRRYTNDFRVLLNYPRRKYQYVPGAVFDSFEKNFIKPARRWHKKKGPFYLNNKNWGLSDVELEEVQII